MWPKLVVGPRFGAAYDLTGNQKLILRGGGGLFYDRPDGNTVFSIPGNPPISTSQDLRNGNLQTLGTGLSTTGVPALSVFQYNAERAGVRAVAGRRADGAARGPRRSTCRTSATTATTGSARSRAAARWT